MKNKKPRKYTAYAGGLCGILFIMSGCGSVMGTPKLETEPAGSIIFQSEQDIGGQLTGSQKNVTEASGNAATVMCDSKDTDVKSDIVGLSQMLPILQGLIQSFNLNGLNYSSSNPEFIWRSLYETAASDINNLRHADKSSSFNVPQTVLLDYLESYFEETVELPDIPPDLSGLISYDVQEKQYIMAYPEKAPVSVSVMHVEKTDDIHSKITLQSASDSGEITFWYIYVARNAEGAYPYVIQYMEPDDYICNDILEGGTLPESK